MATQEQLRRGFILGEWTIRPNLGQIEKAGAILHIEPKLVEVLLHLAESHRQVIERETLLDRAWNKQVVGDEALTRAISELRTLLGDSGRERHYIRTVPKRGYTLIADLDLMEEQPATNTDSSLIPTRRKSVVDKERNNVLNWVEINRLLRYWLLGVGSLTTVALGFVLAFVVFTDNIQMDVIQDAEPHSFRVNTNIETTSANIAIDPMRLNLKSYAVIPFVNLTPKEDLNFFTQGLEEDIRTSLFALPGIKVAGRLSSNQIHQALPSKKSHAISDIAKLLQVDAIVDGTVRLIDGKVRVTVQLLDGKTGFPIWSKRYDKDFDNVLKLQTAIANDIQCELDSRGVLPRLVAKNNNQLMLEAGNSDRFNTNVRLDKNIEEPNYGHTQYSEWLAR